MSLNIQSLSSNILNLRADPTVLKGDIICLQETWCHRTQAIPKLTDEYVCRVLGEGQGKGVAVYVQKTWFKCLIGGEPVGKILDFGWCMKLRFRGLDVLTVNRSPSQNYSHRYHEFVRMVHSLLDPSNAKPTVICGDFNFDYHKDPQNSLRESCWKKGVSHKLSLSPPQFAATVLIMCTSAEFLTPTIYITPIMEITKLYV